MEVLFEMIEVDEKKIFSERLNIALDIAGFPKKGKGRQLQLAALFGVSQESARKWLVGKNFPDTKRIPEIAKRLNVNVQWLLVGVGNIHPATTLEDLSSELSSFSMKVPILSWEEAGSWDKILDHRGVDENRVFAWSDIEVGSNAYALVVEDDSMLSRYEPASILIIDPDYQALHKHIVIYLLENEKIATCKQLIIEHNCQYLKPHNPNSPLHKIREKDKYCGTVRQACVVY